MSSEEPDLPVAAYIGESFTGRLYTTTRDSMQEHLEDGDELVKKSDAREAIQEARQEERQKIREKIEDKIQYENRVSFEVADRPAYAARRLESLRDELGEEVEES